MKLDALCQNGMLSEMAFYSWVEISILCRRPPLWSFKRDRSKEKNKSKGTHRNLQHLDFFLLLSCLTRQLSCSSSSSPWVGHRSAEIEEASSDKGGMAMQEGKGGRLQAGRDKSEETYKTGEIKTLPHLNQLITFLASSCKFKDPWLDSQSLCGPSFRATSISETSFSASVHPWSIYGLKTLSIWGKSSRHLLRDLSRFRSRTGHQLGNSENVGNENCVKLCKYVVGEGCKSSLAWNWKMHSLHNCTWQQTVKKKRWHF